MGMMQGENRGIAVSIGLLLLGVFTLFGVQIAAQPLATAIVEATKAKGVIDLGFIVSFLSFFPMLMLLGGIAAMFTGSYAESRRHSEGEGTAALMRAIIVVIGVLMLPMLIITLVNVSVVYGNEICGTTAGESGGIVGNIACNTTAVEATGLSAPDEVTSSGVYGGTVAEKNVGLTALSALATTKFTAINTFAGLLPLGYIVALINMAIPQIGSRVAGYVRG